MNSVCRLHQVGLLLAFAAFVDAQTVGAEEAALPAGAKVLDADAILYSWPHPNISPDGRWVAYVSKGYVSVCNIGDPEPRRLYEVPDSWTHFLARRDYAHAGGDPAVLFRKLGKDEYQKLTAQVTSRVYGLRWTHNSDGVVFGVQSYDREFKKATYDVRYAGVDGKVTTLGHVAPDSATVGLGGDGVLTRDRGFIVSQDYQKARIWDVAEGRPRASCFLYVAPSPTSGRWIGIEKDTRQLVITDENFEIVKRFDEYRPARSFGFKLDWSPDERFIIWRNQVGFDHYSNWEGFWMNRDTGEKRELSGRFMDEQIAFTGRGGEFYRCGQSGAKTNWYDAVTGAHLTIVPEGEGAPHDVWRIEVERDRRMPGALTNRPGNPPLRPGPRCELFAIGLPRPAGKTSGWIWHLMGREGNKWRFPGVDNGEFISPFEVVGFAEGGKTIVAYDARRIFSFPVETVQSAANKVD